MFLSFAWRSEGFKTEAQLVGVRFILSSHIKLVLAQPENLPHQTVCKNVLKTRDLGWALPPWDFSFPTRVFQRTFPLQGFILPSGVLQRVFPPRDFILQYCLQCCFIYSITWIQTPMVAKKKSQLFFHSGFSVIISQVLLLNTLLPNRRESLHKFKFKIALNFEDPKF